uniref:Uncharacterized protein n=1 Tax=Zea mays TaxID=4577 RepID=C0PL60_MAIZE|nr:unknown [Zea mays]
MRGESTGSRASIPYRTGTLQERRRDVDGRRTAGAAVDGQAERPGAMVSPLPLSLASGYAATRLLRRLKIPVMRWNGMRRGRAGRRGEERRGEERRARPPCRQLTHTCIGFF